MPPTMIPFAIDVTDEVPVDGKPWSGGQGNSKLVLHTIESADPWDIGWPRDWSRWTSAPHLAMNSDRFPDGDWLYQTLPFDVAGYAIKNNDLEDDAFTYQMEMAGRARNVPTYDDQFYEAVAEVAQWFVDEMDVPNRWMDFSCATFGTDSACRHTKAGVDAWSGFLGHCHVGKGTDRHWDPGKLDTERVQSFMVDTGEAPNIDETSSWARESWQKAYDCNCATPNLINGNTHPQDVMTTERFFVMLDRLGILEGE